MIDVFIPITSIAWLDELVYIPSERFPPKVSTYEFLCFGNSKVTGNGEIVMGLKNIYAEVFRNINTVSIEKQAILERKRRIRQIKSSRITSRIEIRVIGQRRADLIQQRFISNGNWRTCKQEVRRTKDSSGLVEFLVVIRATRETICPIFRSRLEFNKKIETWKENTPADVT